MPDKIEQEIEQDNIKTKIQTIVTPNDISEIRKITLENRGLEEEILEVTTYFEPVLSKKEQDYAHPVFNNLFLKFDYDEETNSILVKRRTREKSEKKIYLAVNLFAPEMETIGQLEFEIDKEKFTGRYSCIKKDGKDKTTRKNRIGFNNSSW